VLIDFVPNHTSDQHPFFRDAQRDGPRSPYFDFYDRDEHGEPTHYFDWTNLPNLNYSNPDVERFMTEAFAYWVRELDVDGFRVDACWGVRLRRPDYWPRWRAEVKRIKPDLLLIAEATARDPWYLEHGFDVGYDWTDELGKWAWQDVFGDAGALPAALAAALRADPDPARVFRFLNNNDTGTRFVEAHGAATTRVATALLLTLPGIPCVYTGDEVGARFLPYGEPGTVDWTRDPDGLRAWHRTLIRLRTGTPSLHAPGFTLLDPAPAGRGVVAFLRHAADGSAPVLVLLNFAGEALDVQVQPPEGFAALAGSRLRDLLGGSTIPPGGSPLSVHMTASSAQVLAPEGG
jgi:cyclomaltodextrinase